MKMEQNLKDTKLKPFESKATQYVRSKQPPKTDEDFELYMQLCKTWNGEGYRS